MASKSQVIQLPASKCQPSAPPLYSAASASSSIMLGSGGVPSISGTVISDLSDTTVTSSPSFMSAASSQISSSMSMTSGPAMPPLSASSSTQMMMGARPVLRGNTASILPVSVPPEVKKQQEGMTTFSTANKNLLMLEPCNVDGLPSKRLVDQAEGITALGSISKDTFSNYSVLLLSIRIYILYTISILSRPYFNYFVEIFWKLLDIFLVL